MLGRFKLQRYKRLRYGRVAVVTHKTSVVSARLDIVKDIIVSLITRIKESGPQ